MKKLNSHFYFSISASIVVFLTTMFILKTSFIFEHIGLTIFLSYISGVFIVIGVSKKINK